jgi:hypothetical protein
MIIVCMAGSLSYMILKPPDGNKTQSEDYILVVLPDELCG